MKYPINQERELMTAVWSLNIKDDPLNFVKFVFPWGEKDTPLEHFTGPRKWQEKILRDIQTILEKTKSLIYQRCLDWQLVQAGVLESLH